MTRQAQTKIPIPEATKQVDFSIIEPLTDQEKEEDYKLNLYISTFVSEDTPAVPTSRVHITVKPPTAKVVDPQLTEQQQPTVPPQQQTTPPAPVTIDPTQVQTGEVEYNDPEYALSKSIIKNMAKEIAVARKKLKTQKLQQGRGKRKLILADSSDDEEELEATAVDIVEDARANKVSVEI